MKEKTQIKLSLAGGLSFITLILLAFIGYVANIVAICRMDLTVFSGTLAVRVLGVIVAPLGSMAGWFL